MLMFVEVRGHVHRYHMLGHYRLVLLLIEERACDFGSENLRSLSIRWLVNDPRRIRVGLLELMLRSMFTHRVVSAWTW